MTPNSHNGYRTHCESPVEFVKVPFEPEYDIPDDVRRGLMIDVVHDGDVIPEEFLVDHKGDSIDESVYLQAYWEERDWGAAEIARVAASKLGLPGYLHVHIARVVMDFSRFPGMTRRSPEHLSRFAINYPFSELLGFRQKKRVLESYYDTISAGFDTNIEGVVTKLAVHTYDKFNRSGTPRPTISVLTRAASYQHSSEMPFDVFDPLYPDVLVEYTSDRMLRDRLSLTFEREGFPVAHNYPYLLPDGSVEVRSQVWSYFRHLRHCFEDVYPETTGDDAYVRVWHMLLDTNLRSTESLLLRSYLHMFRRAPAERRGALRQAELAYEHVAAFQAAHLEEITSRYRASPDRMSALGLEVRKDLVWHFKNDLVPLGPRDDEAERIGAILAKAIYTYLKVDKNRVLPANGG